MFFERKLLKLMTNLLSVSHTQTVPVTKNTKSKHCLGRSTWAREQLSPLHTDKLLLFDHQHTVDHSQSSSRSFSRLSQQISGSPQFSPFHFTRRLSSVRRSFSDRLRKDAAYLARCSASFRRLLDYAEARRHHMYLAAAMFRRRSSASTTRLAQDQRRDSSHQHLPSQANQK